MTPRGFQSEAGQSIVIIALLMIAMFAAIGLVIDGGRGYSSQRQSQNASDAAAFAGTHSFTLRKDNSSGTEQQILTAVNQYGLSNRIAATADISATFINASGNRTGQALGTNGMVPEDATGVQVNTTIRFQPAFMSVLTGGGQVEAKTRAALQSGPAEYGDHLMPMTVKVGDIKYNYDSETVLQGDKQAPGGFQWVNYSSPCESNTQDLVSYLTLEKDSGGWYAGNLICGGPGVKPANEINQALDAWKAKPANDRWWLIPVYDYLVNSGSNLLYHIKYFGLFEFDDYNFSGSDFKWVKGRFLRFTIPQHVTHPGPCNALGIDVCAMSMTN